jgi:2-C-methyl-D-erythritol 2,4-cyclodiphosphate synthase
MIKVGFAKDIHELKEGFSLLLGGIKIPSSKGAVSYSDGDCLTHSIIDALLGAIGNSDIGEMFSNKDLKNKGRLSIEMLKEVFDIIVQEGFIINNIDCFISLEKPNLGEYKKLIKKSLAEVLHLKLDQISIKAGTNEGFGAVGEEKAIVCYCICSLEGKENE